MSGQIKFSFLSDSTTRIVYKLDRLHLQFYVHMQL